VSHLVVGDVTEVGVEVEVWHDMSRVADDKVVEREQAALDVRERREHQLVRSHLLDPSVTAHAVAQTVLSGRLEIRGQGQ